MADVDYICFLCNHNFQIENQKEEGSLMKIDLKIKNKVQEKLKGEEELQKYIGDCHRAFICPECGGTLGKKTTWKSFWYSLPGFRGEYKCEECGYSRIC